MINIGRFVKNKIVQEKVGIDMKHFIKQKGRAGKGLAVFLSAVMASTGVPVNEGLTVQMVQAAEGETGEGTETPTTPDTPETVDQSQLEVTAEETNCGTDASYTFTADGTLTISGSGTVSNGVFSGKTNIVKVVIGNGITALETKTFEGCTGITEVTFSETSSLQSIPTECFRGCTSLISISLPESVIQLGNNAFGSCGLQSIEIKNPEINISSGYAFENCKGITSINYWGSESQWKKLLPSGGSPVAALETAAKTYHKFAVTYDAGENGGTIGTGSDTVQIEEYNENTTLNTLKKSVDSSTEAREAAEETGSAVKDTLTARKTGYEFLGWNTDKDATKALDTYQVTTAGKLFAIFAKKITVTFPDAKASEAGNSQESKTEYAYNKNTTITIKAPEGTDKENACKFVGWSTSKTGRENIVRAGENLTLNVGTEYYAVYEQTVTASYESGITSEGGTDTSSSSTVTMPANQTGKRYYIGNTVIEQPQFTLASVNSSVRPGYKFINWTSNNGSYEAGQVFTLSSNDTNLQYTFTAQWQSLAAEAPTITSQPNDITAAYGYNNQTMQVTAVAADSNYMLAYQWYQVGASGSDVTVGDQTSKLSILSGKNAGIKIQYYCVITATRKDNGEKAFVQSNTATFTVEKAERTLSIEPLGKYFNNEAITVQASDYHLSPSESDNVPTITYYTDNSGAIGNKMNELPSTPGTYWVRIAFAETTNYKAVTAEQKFTISYLPTPSGTLYTLKKSDDLLVEIGDWSSSKVIIKAEPGYQIAKDSYTSEFEEQIEISNEGEQTVDIYVKNTDNGYITDKISVPIKIDTTSPTGTIQVKNNIWDSLKETISFSTFFNETQVVSITGNDSASGVQSIQYYVANGSLIEDGTADANKLEDAIRGAGSWKNYIGGISINPNEKYVVYAKITDKAGNVSYLSSDGMVFDNQPPVPDFSDGETIYKNDDFQFKVTDLHLESVTVDGKKYINGSSESVSNPIGNFDKDGQFTGNITPDNKTHSISAKDKAGNQMLVKTVGLYTVGKVTFDLNGGQHSSMADKTEVTVDYNKPVTQPSNPTKAGYSFQGWVTDEVDETTLFDFSKGITKDITLTATWKAKEYTITFDSQGGTVCAEGKVVYNGNYPPLPTPEKTGHEFKGWFTDTTCTTPLSAIHQETNGITLYAKWEVKDYTISFESVGGSACNSIKVIYGEQYFNQAEETKKIPIPTRTGYEFLGWYTAENGGTLIVQKNTEQKAIPTYDIAGNSTLYAHWKALDYTVTLDYQDSLSVSKAKVQPEKKDTIMVTYGGKYNSLPVKENITRDGYIFDGWFTSQAAGAQILNDTTVTESAGSSGNTLYAHWTPRSYTITMHYQDGRPDGTKDVVFEQSYDLENPTREGYTFIGWSLKEESIAESDKIANNASCKIAKNHSLYAHWTANTYKVTLNANKGSFGNDSTKITLEQVVTYDQPYPISSWEEPTRIGYTFDDWYTKETNGTEVTNTTKVTTADHHTLYAHWIAKQYTVTLNPNSGSFADDSIPTTQTVTYDQSYPISGWTEPTKTGYTFDGWYTKETNGTKVTDETIVITANNHTLYAHWNPNEYTVTLNSNEEDFDDNTLSSFTVIYDNVYPSDKLSTHPTRTGYTFAGWFIEKTNGTPIIGGSTSVQTADNHTLYARWMPNTLTFTGKALPDAKYGDSYPKVDITSISESLNGTGSYKYSLEKGEGLLFPDGLRLSSDGTISGTCKANVGDYSFTIRVEDTNSEESATATFTIKVTKGNQSKPDAPKMASKTSSSVTLYAAEGLEYGYCIKPESAGGEIGDTESTGGTTEEGTESESGTEGAGSGEAAKPATIEWNKGDYSSEAGKVTFTFPSSSAQTYIFYAKRKGTDNLEPSEVSEGTEVTLLRSFTVALDSENQTDPSKHYKVVPVDSSISPTPSNSYTYKVDEGSSFKFCVEIDKNYGKTKAFEVKVNGGKVSLDSNHCYTIYNIKADQNVLVTGVGDAEAPTGKLKVGDKEYTFLRSSVYFNTYLNQAAAQGKIKVEASDNLAAQGSELTIQYYLWNQKNALSKSKLEQMESAEWHDYDSSAGIPLSTDGAYVIYVKIEDGSNVTYISSDGIIYDSTSPVFEGLENGTEYPVSQSELGKSFQVKDDNLQSVSVDGMQLSAGADGTYVIPVDGKTHTVKAVDYAGNETVLTNVKVYRRTYSVTIKQSESDIGTILSVTEGERLTQPAIPAKAGNIFAGWHTEDGELYDFNQPVTTDLILIAEWEELVTGGEYAAKELSISSTKIVLEAAEGCTYRCSNGMSSDTPVFTGLEPNTKYTFYVIDENGKAGEPIECTTSGGHQCALNTIPSTIYQGNIYQVSPSVSMNGYMKLSKDPANTRISWRTNREDIIDVVSSGDGMNGCTVTVKKVPYNKNKLVKVTVIGTVYYYQSKGSEILKKERNFKKTVNVQNLCDTVEIDLEAVEEQANGAAVISKGAICLLEKKNVTLKPIINQNVDSNIATNQKLKWYISDKDGKINNKGRKIARVTSKGVLRGVGSGATYVTVATVDSYDKHKKEYKVKATYPVVAQWVQKIGFSASVSTTAKKGSKLDLKQSLELTPGEIFNADKMRYQWKSSDTKVASVTSKGVVTFKNAGTVEITCQPTGGWEIGASTGSVKEDSKQILASITFTVSE